MCLGGEEKFFCEMKVGEMWFLFQTLNTSHSSRYMLWPEDQTKEKEETKGNMAA